MTAQEEAKAKMMGPLTRHPVTVVRQAVEWAQARQIQVALKVRAWGVDFYPGGDGRGWMQHTDGGPVSPLGVVLLVRQPGNGSLITAAAEVLETPRAYVEGFLCGSEHTEPNGHQVRMPTVKFYMVGIEHGARFRLEFTHGRRVK